MKKSVLATRATLLLATFLTSAGSAVAQDDLAQVYHSPRFMGNTANAPFVADLFGSEEPEIVVTDVKGTVKVLPALTRGELLQTVVAGGSLTAPVVGDFFGEGFRDIAFGTSSGNLVILDGSSLEVIADRKVGINYSVQPTLVTVTEDDGTRRDRLVITDQDGSLQCFSIDPSGAITSNWRADTGSKVMAPIAVGHLRSSIEFDLVAVTTDGWALLMNPMTGATLPQDKILIEQGSAFQTTPLMVDLDRSSDLQDEMILTNQGGKVFALKWEPQRRPALQVKWFDSLSGNAIGGPLLLQRSGDSSRPLILQVTDAGFQVLNPELGLPPGASRKLAVETTVLRDVSTPVALIPRPNRYPEIAYGRLQSIGVTTNVNEWLESSGAAKIQVREVSVGHSLNRAITAVIGNGSDGVLILGLSGDDSSNLYGFKTDLQVGSDLWPNRVPWATNGGGAGHVNQLDKDGARLERDRRAQATQTIDKWKTELETASAASDWDKASELAAKLVSSDPTSAGYKSQLRNIRVRSNILWIVSGAVAFFVAAGYSAFLIFRFLTFSRIRSQAESAQNRGDLAEARAAYTRLRARAPRNPKVSLALANVVMAQRDYSEEALPIFEAAYNLRPDDQNLLHAYSRALLLEPKTTPQAGEIYQKALPNFPEPHLLEYALGRVYLAQQNYDEAGKRLRAALRGGVTSDALYRALCETYIRTGNYTAKALPVFEQQYPTRLDDREFLEAYLLACIDGRKTEPQVESLCQGILDLNRNFVPAYLHLATILLQKGQIGAAVQEVQGALKVAPDNTQAVGMLAQCYLAQTRRDEEALHAYRNALRLEPENRDLLRVLSTIFFERGSYDEEAVEVYHRSIEVNPGDITTLRALAQTAQLTGNADLSIRAIEALSSAGQVNQKLVTQLADAYVRKGLTEPKAERVLREAIRLEPQNPEYIGALARVLALQDRTEPDAIPIYEAHLRNFAKDATVGRQLAKSYIKADRFESALTVTQSFLKIAPNDDEFQRLNALASLYDNKIDAAVSEYQQLLERNPNDPEALLNMALAYGQKLRTDDEAVALYDRAIKIQPNNDRLHLAKARVGLSRGDAVTAVDSYKAALKSREGIEPKVIAHLTAMLAEYPDALRIRWFLVELLVTGSTLREAIEQLDFIAHNHPGQTNNILRALETILSKDPNNLGALLQRGTLLLTNGQLDDAARMLEKAYQLRPNEQNIVEKLAECYNALLEKKDNPEIRFRLGRLHFAQQDFDKAIGCFQKTAQDYRWEAESTKMLGKAFTSKGMLDLALQEFKKLVVDEETKELLYDLAQRYEAKRDLVGAKTVYRQLFAADINYKDVQSRFEMLSGSTSDPMAFERTSIVQAMGEEAARRYELLDELGRGAMGIVYRARDKELEEVVALKILPDNMSNNPEAVRRFKIEARNARKLSHPHIVRIHDIGEEMGRKYISMEYVDGSDLKRKVKTSPDFKMPIKDAVRFSIQIADALGYAHKVGVVHRDIKPANIMLTSGEDVKVTDFGIAKLMDGAGEGTMIGAVIGTPLYMSPEQVQGIPVDNRADIYAYGIMFYELLSGRPPFTEGDLAYQHIHREPTPLEGLPEGLWPIVAKCLAKKKEDRWDNAEQISEALKALVNRHKLV